MFKFLKSQEPRLSTLKRWSLLSGQVAGMQVLVQGVSAITGLLLIRALPKEEYAWFTLAASMLATLNLLADGGLSTALTSIGGRVYQDAPAFSRLLADARRLAWRLGLLGALLATPFFWHLYARLGTPVGVTSALLALAVGGCVPVILSSILTVPLRLHSRAAQAQGAELLGACTRLLLCGVLLWVGWVDARAMFAGTVLASVVHLGRLRRQTREFTLPTPAGSSHRPEILGFVRSLYGNYLFFCVQGQVATWVIGWLAGVEEVADLGALSRLAVIFAAFGAPFTHLVAPSMARIQELPVLRRRFVLAMVAVFGSIALVLAVAAWQPVGFLWLLGEKYVHLQAELLLALAAQGLTLATSVCWGLIIVRGWVRHAWVTIVTSLAGLAAGAALFQLDTVRGMLSLLAVSWIPTLLLCLIIIAKKLR
jgi:O-antigen/teichoic acid export membrane protein